MAWYLLLLLSLPLSYAQSISTTIPVPPLQWINLTSLLSGPSPPPLKDASIGYDETSRTLIIFGGEADGSFVQSQTHLLNLDTLTWTTPSPPESIPSTSNPSARSAAVGGNDFAASNRHGFVVIGGKGSEGNSLDDVWEYDYNNQFWSRVVLSPGGPSPRWGASGGIDLRVAPIQDTVLPGPNNTIYLAGGFDGRQAISLSDIWRLNLSGTLSSNMPNTVSGSWDHITVDTLPDKIDQAGTMILQRIVAVGGCNISSVSGDSCAQQDSYVINTETDLFISPDACPAPRLSASLVQNLNDFSTSFSSQVFLLLGTFNTSLWQDDDGLQNGEVAILDVDTGTWGRVLPSGDPGTSGTPTFPGPREGAAAFSFASTLVGLPLSRSAASDTIVFGGRDASGKYLSDVWLLRAYKASLTKSNQTWSGFGNGRLQTGTNASGTGVTVQYISRCASAIASQTGSSTVPTTTSTTSPSTPLTDTSQMLNTSLTHKLLAPLSVALLLPAVLLFRLSAPWFYIGRKTERHIALLYMSALVAVVAYGIGIAGISTSFTTIRSMVHLAKRSSSSTLRSAHGKAGIILFAGLYGLVPLLIVFSACLRRSRNSDESKQKLDPRGRANSTETTEKLASQGVPVGIAPHIDNSPSPPSSPRTRVHSLSGMWRGSHDERVSNDSESISSAGAQRTFEVVNRPPRRVRNASGSWLAVPTGEPLGSQRNPITGRSLRDVDWLDRRRSLNAVGELDYHLSQANRAQESSPATTDGLVVSTTPTVTLSIPRPVMPRFFDSILRGLFHVLLLGLCILTLLALWSGASKAIFVVFLVWVAAFYFSLFMFSWRGRPQKSILTTLISWLRVSASERPSPSFSPPISAGADQFPFPTDFRSPYVNQPPYRAAFSGGHDDVSNSHGGPRSVETDDYDDDDDEDTRQRRIEDEMGRRDVNIVTVPKRRLLIANPS